MSNLEKEKNANDLSIKKEVLSWIISIGIALILAFLIVKFVGERTVVIGHSMENTLSDKDNLIVEKLSYRFNEPKRFDIVVFPDKLDKSTHYIKRIIGLPGETIRIDENGQIYVNNKILKENYGKEVIKFQGLAESPITLKNDEYFVLGDNRNNSADSRVSEIGLVTKEEILGKAWARVFPLNNMEFIEHQ